MLKICQIFSFKKYITIANPIDPPGNGTIDIQHIINLAIIQKDKVKILEFSFS